MVTMHSSKDISDLKESALFIKVSDLASTAGCSESKVNISISVSIGCPMFTWGVNS